MKVNHTIASQDSKTRHTFNDNSSLLKKGSLGNRSTNLDDTASDVISSNDQDQQIKEYSNGSYILDKFSKDTLFIAIDAPLEKQFEKFWLIVWNEDIRHIYCLTKTLENGQVQADQYWPSTSLTTKSFEIKCLSKLPKPFFTKRVIEIRNKQSGETKTVVHYQITE